MAGIAILKGPDAPASAALGFCTVCAMAGKRDAMAGLLPAVEAHERGGEGVKIWQLELPRAYLQRAVAWSLIPSLGIAAPVCWSHVVIPKASGVVPVTGALGNGPGHIPLLGQ
jgi:hypothetical protein